MERPSYFNYNRDRSRSRNAESMAQQPDVSRLAGHITLGENSTGRIPLHPNVPSKAGERIIAATIGAETPPAESKDVQFSAWHRIEKDEQGNVKSVAEQRYGKAILREMEAEQGMSGAQSTPVVTDDSTTSPPAATPIQPTPYPQFQAAQPQSVVPIYQQPTAQLPLTNPAQQPSEDVAPTPQPAQFSEPDLPIMPSQPAYPPTAFSRRRGALNPSLQPTQVADQELLATGPLTQDPEHMLPAPAPNRLRTIIQSPWSWLIVGVGLIIYFL